MVRKVGRNRNEFSETDTETHTLDSVTAVTIAEANSARLFLSVTLDPNTITDARVFIRYYPAATDNIKHGTDVLTRVTTANDNLFHDRHEMDSDNVYTGEISAITNAGTLDVTVTEG